MSETFGVTAHAVRDLGFRDGQDVAIFHAAREAGAVIMSKDSDFVLLLERFGPPPQILWITCGNTSNARLRDILRKGFPEAKARLERPATWEFIPTVAPNNPVERTAPNG